MEEGRRGEKRGKGKRKGEGKREEKWKRKGGGKEKEKITCEKSTFQWTCCFVMTKLVENFVGCEKR